MATPLENAAVALELLPEEMREPVAAYWLEQAKKSSALKKQIADGMEDIARGRVTVWNLDEFLQKARTSRLK
jgi:hypothetical protein